MLRIRGRRRYGAHCVGMSEKDETHKSVDAEEISHVFDQTNGIVEGLEGDADDPEVFEESEERKDPTIGRVVPGFNPPL